MFNCLGMAYNDPDYTVMIVSCTETHLGGGVMNALSFHRPTLFKHLFRLSLAAQLSGKAHEDFDHTLMHWCLCPETDNGGELFVLPLAAIARFDSIVFAGMAIMLTC